jgi:four helix bundle protein
MQPFENLRVWDLAQDLSVAIDELTERPAFRRATGLRGQLRKSAAGIGAMIAEGAGRRTPAQFLHFLDIARASADETRSHLDKAARRGIISRAEYRHHASECRLVARMLSTLIRRIEDAHGAP